VLGAPGGIGRGLQLGTSLEGQAGITPTGLTRQAAVAPPLPRPCRCSVPQGANGKGLLVKTQAGQAHAADLVMLVSEYNQLINPKLGFARPVAPTCCAAWAYAAQLTQEQRRKEGCQCC